MKKKILVSILSAILALSMTACGAQAQPKVETEAPVVAEAPETTPEPAEEPEVEAPAKEAKTEEVVPEETETEELAEEVEAEVTEIETETEEIDPMEALLNSNMSSYVSDGVFDAEKFANDTGASWWAIGDASLIFVYNNWFIQTGNGDEATVSFTAIGNWDESNDERYNLCTYSYVFPIEEDIRVGDGLIIPIECIIHLQDIFSSVNGAGTEATPNILGTDFKPCDPMNATTQH